MHNLLASFIVTIHNVVTMKKGGIYGGNRVYQKNKKTGVTYAYESISYWDKEKQQSRAKRKCIGRVDPETNKIIPTRKRKAQTVETKAKSGVAPVTLFARKFYGATYLFGRIGEESGVVDDLKNLLPRSFPSDPVRRLLPDHGR